MSEQEPSLAVAAKPNGSALLSRWRSRVARRTLLILVALYGVATVAVWALLHFGGDRWWLATLMLFGPRWVYALPLPLLAVLAAISSPRLLWPLAALAVVHLGPIMGFEVHGRGAAKTQPPLRVMSFNVDGWSVDNQQLMDFIREIQPDVVALQEFPHPGTLGAQGQKAQLVWPAGWHVVHYDEYLLATPLPILEWEHFDRPAIPGDTSGVAYTLERNGEKLRFFNLHPLSPRPGLQAVLSPKVGGRRVDKLVEIIEVRRKESEALRSWVAESTLPTIVAGDFNMPPDSTIFRADWSRLSDAFSRSGFGFGYTKVTVKWGVKYGARIDHALYGPDSRVRRCWVGPDLGSDHLPLIADLD